MPKMITDVPKTPTEAIGRQIRSLRTDLGLSQKALAEAIDTPLVTYQKQESGKSNLPVSDLFVIGEVLRTPVLEILSEALRKFGSAFEFVYAARGEDVGKRDPEPPNTQT